jgi:hypothetical protein
MYINQQHPSSFFFVSPLFGAGVCRNCAGCGLFTFAATPFSYISDVKS